LQHAQDLMAAQARILAPALATLDSRNLAEWTARAGSQSGARVTVIDRNGLVLADSQHDPATMDNHATRPEVRQALTGKTGTAVRHSDTLNAMLCYLAVPAEMPGQGGVIFRLAVPLQQIDVAVSAVRWLILGAFLVAAAFALIIAYIASRRFTARIRRIQNFAHDLVNEEYSGTLASEADDELGSVARSLRGMADQFRRMLRILADESARRTALLGGMVEGVLAVDPDLRVTFCNRSFAQALKLREPPPGQVRVIEMVRDPELLELLRQVLATGQPSRRRLTLAAATGRVFDVQGAPVGPNPAAGAIAVLHDVTDLERLERVRKDFVANISHELRTPLAAIRSYAETLLDGALDDPEYNRKFLEVIARNAVRMGDMASDLLALSELEAEREPAPVEKVSVRDVAVAALRTVENEAVNRHVDVFAGTIEDVHIMGQRFRLEHALLNLLTNAVRFNRPHGEVRLAAILVGDQVKISVSDTGIGIPFQDLPRIFERFYCVDKAHSRETGGTGLGLSIVRHMTEKMGGSISVESRLGKGSTFTLLFPVG
jgi:two-component system phosphate regulon sensor histidine kinase PhoR